MGAIGFFVRLAALEKSTESPEERKMCELLCSMLSSYQKEPVRLAQRSRFIIAFVRN